MRRKKTIEELDEIYKNRSVLTELDFCRKNFKSGHITEQEADYYRWLFNKAYQWIKEGL